MAKIKCPECGTKYNGNFCPNCSAAAPEGAQKKKKKWLLPALIIVVAIFLIAGMGGGDGMEQPSGVQGGSNSASKVSIEETELYHANGVVVTATKFEKGLFGAEVSFTVSNESNRNIVVSSRDLSVNGYMLPSSGMYSDVAAGKKSIATMSLLSSELAEAGIETVADIEFNLHIYDSDTYDDIDNSDLIKLSTSAAEGFTQPVDDSGDVVYDANGIRVICKGLKDDVIWDGCVVFYIENNNNKYITVYSENVSVNGFMVDESLWSDLRANTRSIEGMYLMTLDDIGLESIDEVENIEFNLYITDKNWNRIAVSNPITLNFN